jgi:hypothetical protein
MPRLFEKKKHYRVRTSVAIAVCMQENLRWLCAPIKEFKLSAVPLDRFYLYIFFFN